MQMKEYKPKKLCLSYIERTGLYIKKLRTGSSYDDESGLTLKRASFYFAKFFAK